MSEIEILQQLLADPFTRLNLQETT